MAQENAWHICEGRWLNKPSSGGGQHSSAVKTESAGSEGDIRTAEAKLAWTGDGCVNLAHDGFRTCGISSHREQEHLFAKKAKPNPTVTGLAQGLGNGLLNKPVADGLVEENKRLKETRVKYESKIESNSRVIADLERINGHLASLLTDLRGKVNRMMAFIEELFEGDVGA